MNKYKYDKKELLDLFSKYLHEIKSRFSMSNALFDNENIFLENILDTYQNNTHIVNINELLDISSKTCKTQELEKVLTVENKNLTKSMNKTYKEFKPNTFDEVKKFCNLVCFKYYYQEFQRNLNTIIKCIICLELINYIQNIKDTTIYLHKELSNIEIFDNYIDKELLPKYTKSNLSKNKLLLDVKNVKLVNLCYT